MLRVSLWVIIYVVGLCVFAPASLMSSLLGHFSDGKVVLARTEGSFWRGSGVLLLQGSSRHHVLGRYRWELNADGSMTVFSKEVKALQAHIEPLSARLVVDRLQLTLPAGLLEVASSQLGPYRLQGEMTAQGGPLNVARDGINGALTLDWLNASSGLSAVRPLGNYRLSTRIKGTDVEADLSTLAGKLQLSGRVSYRIGGAINLGGMAQAALESDRAELKELLHYIGPEIRPGVHSVSLMPQSAHF